MHTPISGLIAATVTGYHPDGSVNLEIIRRYAEMLCANGIRGVFINGTTGEGLALTLRERKDLAESWVEAASGRLIIIVHVGHTCQKDSQYLAAHAAEIGADGIGEIGPIFYSPQTVKNLVDYAAATAEAAQSLPYYYYHIPSMSHVIFPMIRFLELASKKIPALHGIKYSYDDWDDFEACLKFREGQFDILFGQDELLLHALKLGGQAAVGSSYNIIAPVYHQLFRAFNENDFETAGGLQNLSAKTCSLMTETGGYGSALKALLKRIGLDFGGMRRPQLNLNRESIRELEKSLQRTGVFEYLNYL